MLAFAQIALAPGNFISWIIVGGIAGWVTGRVMQSGYGFFGDIILGLIGALVGGFLGGFFFDASTGFFGTLIVAILGSVLIVAIARAFGRATSTTSRL